MTSFHSISLNYLANIERGLSPDAINVTQSAQTPPDTRVIRAMHHGDHDKVSNNSASGGP